MDHLNGQGPLSAQDLRCARARTEQFGKLRLRMPTLFDEISQHVDRVDARGIDRPMLILIFFDKRRKNVELVTILCSGIGIPQPIDFGYRGVIICLAPDWADFHGPLRYLRPASASPNASNSARLIGLRCGSYSACHCTPSAKPGASAIRIASMVPSSATPSMTTRAPNSRMPCPCSEFTRMVSRPSSLANAPPGVRWTSWRSANTTVGSGWISPFSSCG